MTKGEVKDKEAGTNENKIDKNMLFFKSLPASHTLTETKERRKKDVKTDCDKRRGKRQKERQVDKKIDKNRLLS